MAALGLRGAALLALAAAGCQAIDDFDRFRLAPMLRREAPTAAAVVTAGPDGLLPPSLGRAVVALSGSGGRSLRLTVAPEQHRGHRFDGAIWVRGGDVSLCAPSERELCPDPATDLAEITNTDGGGYARVLFHLEAAAGGRAKGLVVTTTAWPVYLDLLVDGSRDASALAYRDAATHGQANAPGLPVGFRL